MHKRDRGLWQTIPSTLRPSTSPPSNAVAAFHQRPALSEEAQAQLDAADASLLAAEVRRLLSDLESARRVGSLYKERAEVAERALRNLLIESLGITPGGS